MLRWLITTIGLAALKGEAKTMARRAARRATLYFLLLLVWLAALGFAIAAITVWIASALGAIAACCIMAGALLVIGLLILLGLALTSRRRDTTGSGLGGAIPNLGAPELTGMASIAVIVLTGYLLGRHLFRR